MGAVTGDALGRRRGGVFRPRAVRSGRELLRHIVVAHCTVDRVELLFVRQLRAVVHIVDMHQLTKDPEHLLVPSNRTASSPELEFTRFELSRYLDYCSELLSLSSKLAALHAQYVNDPVVLDAVNDIEVLASNLSNKIWQKIMILDTMPGLE